MVIIEPVQKYYDNLTQISFSVFVILIKWYQTNYKKIAG